MKLFPAAMLALLGFSPATLALADSVTLNTNANQLASAITAGNTGVTVTGASLQGQTLGGASSTGTFTNIYGLSSGGVISTGNAADYGSGPNNSTTRTTDYSTTATAAQSLLLDPLTGGYTNHHDVTELDINFTVDPGVSSIFFNVAFGSEEYPTFVGSSFVDAFGLYLNGINLAFVGGQPVNIDNSCFQALAGTELNGVLACGGNPVNTFTGNVFAGTNTLQFIISDTSDGLLDTTAYLGALGTTNVAATPEPSTIVLLGTGVLTTAGAIRRRFRG